MSLPPRLDKFARILKMTEFGSRLSDKLAQRALKVKRFGLRLSDKLAQRAFKMKRFESRLSNKLAQRAFKAVGIVVALIVVVPLVDEIAFRPFADGQMHPADGQAYSAGEHTYSANGQAQSTSEQTYPSYEGINTSSLLAHANAEETLASLENLASNTLATQDVPLWFSEHVGLVENARDYRANASKTVLSYIVETSPAQALLQLESHMDAAGWSHVSLGSLDGASFLNPANPHQWIVASCTETNNATCVVLRYAS